MGLSFLRNMGGFENRCNLIPLNVCYPTLPTPSGPFCRGVRKRLFLVWRRVEHMYTKEKELMQRLMKNRNRIKGNVYWEGEW